MFGGSIEQDGEQYVVGLEIEETIDPVTGRVVETTRNINKPSDAHRHVISDRGYQSKRAYLVGKRIEQERIMRWRAANMKPCPKPKPSRRPKNVASSVVCPDCNGAGWLDGGDCPACQGEGWRVG